MIAEYRRLRSLELAVTRYDPPGVLFGAAAEAFLSLGADEAVRLNPPRNSSADSVPFAVRFGPEWFEGSYQFGWPGRAPSVYVRPEAAYESREVMSANLRAGRERAYRPPNPDEWRADAYLPAGGGAA